MHRTTVRSAALAVPLLVVAGCQRGSEVRFNPLASAPATAPADAATPAPSGSSRAEVTGEIAVSSTVDFQCSVAPDDFFIRGLFGRYDGIDVYLSINVEFYTGPGTYRRKTQVLVRRIDPERGYYAAWYAGHATMTVRPGGRGAELVATALPPEAGTSSTRPVRISGSFACQAGPR